MGTDTPLYYAASNALLYLGLALPAQPGKCCWHDFPTMQIYLLASYWCTPNRPEHSFSLFFMFEAFCIITSFLTMSYHHSITGHLYLCLLVMVWSYHNHLLHRFFVTFSQSPTHSLRIQPSKNHLLLKFVLKLKPSLSLYPIFPPFYKYTIIVL